MHAVCSSVAGPRLASVTHLDPPPQRPLLAPAAGGRKRPLVPNLAELLEGEEEGEGAQLGAASRRSDGAALLRERQSVGSGMSGGGASSPPHKLPRSGEPCVVFLHSTH